MSLLNESTIVSSDSSNSIILSPSSTKSSVLFSFSILSLNSTKFSVPSSFSILSLSSTKFSVPPSFSILSPSFIEFSVPSSFSILSPSFIELSISFSLSILSLNSTELSVPPSFSISLSKLIELSTPYNSSTLFSKSIELFIFSSLAVLVSKPEIFSSLPKSIRVSSNSVIPSSLFRLTTVVFNLEFSISTRRFFISALNFSSTLKESLSPIIVSSKLSIFSSNNSGCNTKSSINPISPNSLFISNGKVAILSSSFIPVLIFSKSITVSINSGSIKFPSKFSTVSSRDFILFLTDNETVLLLRLSTISTSKSSLLFSSSVISPLKTNSSRCFGSLSSNTGASSGTKESPNFVISFCSSLDNFT